MGTIALSKIAQAYVPPASFILERLAKSHAHLRQIEIEGRVIDVQARGSFRELLRLDFSTHRGVAYAMNEAGEILGMRVFKISDLPHLGLAWLVLSFDPSTAQLKDALQKLNVVPPVDVPAESEADRQAKEEAQAQEKEDKRAAAKKNHPDNRKDQKNGLNDPNEGDKTDEKTAFEDHPDTIRPSANESIKLARLGSIVTWGGWGEANSIYFSKGDFSFVAYQIGVPVTSKEPPAQSIYVSENNHTNTDVVFPKAVHVAKTGNDLFTYEVKSTRFGSFSKTTFPKPTATVSSVEAWFDLVR